MNFVDVRGVKIGKGIPKICVPIVGLTKEEIFREAVKLADTGADIAEWRADWFEEGFCAHQVVSVLGELRKILGDMPILFTFRTSQEGGKKEIVGEEYTALNRAAVNSGFADLIDVEAFSAEGPVKTIIHEAHGRSVKVIASNHDFHRTPEKEDIIARLRHMQRLGADICKIAVMPKNKKDVLTLLQATEEMVREYADRPIITMSMAGEGTISRMCGELFGSSVTFGTAGRASAPGQIKVEKLRSVLNILHESIEQS